MAGLVTSTVRRSTGVRLCGIRRRLWVASALFGLLSASGAARGEGTAPEKARSRAPAQSEEKRPPARENTKSTSKPKPAPAAAPRPAAPREPAGSLPPSDTQRETSPKDAAESNASAPKEGAAKETAPKDPPAKEPPRPKDVSVEPTPPKPPSSKDTASKQTAAKNAAVKPASAKDTGSKAQTQQQAPEKPGTDKPSADKPSADEPSKAAASEEALDAAEDRIDPKRGRGARSVAEDPLPSASMDSALSEAPPLTEAPRKEPLEPAGSKKTSGKAQKRSVLPAGAARPEPDALQRRLIAQGPTQEELLAGKDDVELRSLRDAELVLFPRPLPGFVPGWSWDLPRATESASLPELITGAPPGSRAERSTKEAAPDADWLRGLSMPNLPVKLEERVVKYLAFYRDSPSGRAIGRAWAKKSGRYTQALRAELAKAGLPSDLVWLSLIESGHNPRIVSPVGAAGLWQFMPDAGRAYGLAIDRWVDERLDPERSTQAACRFLSDLYQRFGSWDLAMAAYNMGHAGLSRAIRKYNTNDFWALGRYEAGIPWETTLYVPKILATAIVMSNRRSFGVDDVEGEPSEQFETVRVASGLQLSELSRMIGASNSALEELNPQYLAGRTPPAAPNAGQRSWPVRVPLGLGVKLGQALSRETPNDESLAAYVVRTGDTVESIAQLRGATGLLIRSLNRIDVKEALAPGTVLLVPRTSAPEPDHATDNVVVISPRTFRYTDRRRVFYRVETGDSVARVAEAFGVSRTDVVLWNALDGSARLHSGMTLELYVQNSRDLSRVRHLPEAKARILVAGSPDFFAYFEGQSGKRRFVVRARGGETLAAIGRRYGMSAGSMERANRRSRSDPVQPGEPVVVYTERTRPAPGDRLYVDARARAASDAPGGAAAIADVAAAP